MDETFNKPPAFMQELQKHHKSMVMKDHKSGVLAKDTRARNFVFIYGTNPSSSVAIDTKMIKNYFDNILNKQDKETKSVEFPRVMEKMHSDDAAFELTVSNSIQKMILYHKSSPYRPCFNNVVTHSLGAVFLNSA